MSCGCNGTFHMMDGIRAGTIEKDEPLLAERVVNNYVQAFCEQQRQIRAFAEQQFPGQKYAIIFQLKREDRINTRKIKWCVIPDYDPEAKKFKWEDFDPKKELFLYIQVFYGDDQVVVHSERISILSAAKESGISSSKKTCVRPVADDGRKRSKQHRRRC